MASYNELFDRWSITYDETVFGDNNEYTEVFENYDGILKEIASILEDKKDGKILEIGVGTGNVIKYLDEKGMKAKGVEPSLGMRSIAKKKLPHVDIVDGHFMNIPFVDTFDGIVTSYALHHLNLHEKEEALIYLDGILNKGGRIIVADTMFESQEYKSELYRYVEGCRQFNLLKDLNTEHYEYIADLTNIFNKLGYSYDLIRINKFVWILSAVKGGE